MKKRKGIAVLLILILSLAVTACGDRYGVKEGESYIYCMNTDKTGLVKVAAKISGNSAIKKAESVIDEMKKPTNEIEYTQAIPEQVKLLDCAFSLVRIHRLKRCRTSCSLYLVGNILCQLLESFLSSFTVILSIQLDTNIFFAVFVYNKAHQMLQ